MPLVYEELHRIARRQWVRQSSGHTLQPTALIHEAFLKLMGSGEKSFQCRTQFFALASLAMRQVLVNHAEASLAEKRGGNLDILPLDGIDPAVQQEAKDVLDLHEALNALHQIDPRKSRVVELRYFGGLSIDETADVLDISSATVAREWQTARAWLAREIKHGGASAI